MIRILDGDCRDGNGRFVRGVHAYRRPQPHWQKEWLEGGTVLDPFGGAGTTGLVADRLKRSAVLIELNPEYAAMARKRIQADAGMFAEVA